MNDGEHRVPHGSGRIKMPSVADRVLRGEHQVWSVGPHDTVKMPIINRRKKIK